MMHKSLKPYPASNDNAYFFTHSEKLLALPALKFLITVSLAREGAPFNLSSILHVDSAQNEVYVLWNPRNHSTYYKSITGIPTWLCTCTCMHWSAIKRVPLVPVFCVSVVWPLSIPRAPPGSAGPRPSRHLYHPPPPPHHHHHHHHQPAALHYHHHHHTDHHETLDGEGKINHTITIMTSTAQITFIGEPCSQPPE